MPTEELRVPTRPRTTQDVIDSVIDHVAELVVVVDGAGYVLWVNEAVERLLGWTPTEWIGRHATELAHPDDLALGMELLSSAKATGAGVKEAVIYRLAHRNGNWVDLECISSNVAVDGAGLVLVVSGRPAREIRPSTAIFDEAAARVSSMFDDAAIGMAQIALDGSVLRINRYMADMLGSEPQQLVGRHRSQIADALFDRDGHDFRPEGELPPRDQQVRIERLDGTARHARVSWSLVNDHRGEPMYYAVQAIDVTDLVLAEQDLLHRSTHDPLTGLANRAVLDRMFDGDGLRGTTALIYLDLDRFKPVNDRYGHAAGDDVLCAIADRLRREVRGVDVVVRLGGDEFAIVCGDVERGEALVLADRLVRVCAEPITLDGATVQLAASAGVAFTQDPGLGDLLRRADSALYMAKSSGGDSVATDDELPPVRR